MQIRRLELAPQSIEDVRSMIASLSPEDRAQVSDEWLARANAPDADQWTLGFQLIDRERGTTVGHAGFKGPPADDGSVEIAYGVSPEYQRQGYGTEAALSLVEYARASGRVRVVRAHTLPEPNASTRILKKSGFEMVGEVSDPEDGRVWRWELLIG